MKYATENLAQRLRLGEDSDWEFKEIRFRGDRPVAPRRDDLADEIAAFANAGGGTLLCGVTDSGEVVGMSRAEMEALDNFVVELSTDAIHPAVRVEVRRRVLGGKSLVVVEIPKGGSQHDSPGGSFVRVGASKRRMTTDERLRLAQRRGQFRYRWPDEQPVPDTGFGTLDADLWKPFLTAEGANSPKAALRKLGLLVVDDEGVLRATVAGVLFCCRSPEEWIPNAGITATRYRGVDRATGQVDAQTIRGPLPRQIADAVAFASRNMAVAAHKIPARAELPQYSPEAIFEAVVNAVAHRDYSMRSSRIRLSLFSDRLEIQSPGGLPNNLTVEDLPHRQATRNERITSLFGRMEATGIAGAGGRVFIIERRGDGVPIMRRRTEELTGRFPEFRLVGDADLLVTLPAASLEPSGGDASIAVHSIGGPVAEVDLLLLFPDRTTRRARTDSAGEARLDLHVRHLPVTVFAARPGFAAGLVRGWTPASGALRLDLEPLPDGGGVVFVEGDGQVPGLTGILTPAQDPYDRALVYGAGLSINEGQPQPVRFLPGDPLRLTDSEGRERVVRVLAVAGDASLVEYRSVEED